jgi:hypothetical protein
MMNYDPFSRQNEKLVNNTVEVYQQQNILKLKKNMVRFTEEPNVYQPSWSNNQ